MRLSQLATARLTLPAGSCCHRVRTPHLTRHLAHLPPAFAHTCAELHSQRRRLPSTKQPAAAMDKRIGFIGAGQMAEALARGFIAKGVCRADQVFATDVVQVGASRASAPQPPWTAGPCIDSTVSRAACAWRFVARPCWGPHLASPFTNTRLCGHRCRRARTCSAALAPTLWTATWRWACLCGINMQTKMLVHLMGWRGLGCCVP